MRRFATLILVLSALCVRNGRSDTTFYDTVTWDFGSSLIVNSGINVTFSPGSTVNATGATLIGFPGGTGASSFLGLVDTPSSYSGQAGNFVAVNPGATALVFVPPPGGGGGTGTVTNFTAGNLSPLFNTSVTNPSTTPNLAFSLLNVGAGLFWGNETGVTAAPHYVQPGFTNLSGTFSLAQTPSLAAGALVGRTSTGAGSWQAITVGTGLTMTGTTLSSVAGVVSAAAPSPSPDQVAIWTDATHIKGVKAITGGTTGQVLKKNSNTDYDYVWAADLIGGAGGASAFIGLSDVPSSYVGSGGRLVAVNSSENGLEFILAPSGGGSVTSVFGRTGVVTALVGDYSAFYQPLDSDLTAIAALTTTTFGRGFLTLADATSSRSYIGAGTSNFDGTWTSLTGKPTTLAGFGITDAQPLDGDLTAIAALTGLNNIYYRSAANTWSSVTFGSNMTWGSGTLNAANTNWDTAFTDRMKWDGQSTGLNAATGRISLGLVIGTNVQAWDADLDSLAAAAATGAMYYRSAANTWSTVTIGSGLTFSAGTLTAAGTGDVSSNTSLSVDGEIVLFNGVTGKSVKRAVGSGIVTVASGVMGTITDNSANWNTAFTNNLRWDGGATGLNVTTAKASLAITATDVGLGSVTNNLQTQAAVMPNTAPLAGQIPVGNGTSYVPRTVSGSGATMTMGSTGIMSISAIPNASLNNSSVTIGNAVATALGGTVSTDAIIGASGLGYMKRTGTNTYTATTTSIPNADLANSSITIGNATATALGGTVGADAILGMSGIGLVKRTGASAYALAVAGTDYKVGTQNTINVRTVTTTSTFTPSAGVTSLFVEGVGGGGGGGGESVTGTNAAGAGGSGGGGGYASVYIATPASSYSVTIGAGGTAGSAAGGNGGAGGNTTFGTLLTAGGGGGGTGMTSGIFAQAASNAFAGAGGTATIGGILIPGQDGGPWFCMGASGTTVWGVTGDGGNSQWGAGARGKAGHSAAGGAVAGDVGGKYGGGGSGAYGGTTAGAKAGGAGAPGLIKVTEIF